MSVNEGRIHCGLQKRESVFYVTKDLIMAQRLHEAMPKDQLLAFIDALQEAANDLDQNVLAYGDNLDYLRAMPAESVDLVYLDPPFNTGRAFNNTMGTDAQAKAYDDTWTWGKDDERALRHFAKEHPELGKFLLALGAVLPTQGLYRLVSMSTRLFELHRVLKPTGSLYLHVDDTACHYLKMVLDKIFGWAQNQISWLRSDPKNGQLKQFGRCTDTILFYSKSTLDVQPALQAVV